MALRGHWIFHHSSKNSHPQYNKYATPALFKKFKIEGGNIVWGKNWDLMFPVEQLHTGILL